MNMNIPTKFMMISWFKKKKNNRHQNIVFEYVQRKNWGLNTNNDRLLVIHGAEAIADKYDTGVNEESDENTGSDDFRVWILFFVQVPCSTDAQKFSAVARSIENEDD